MTFDEIKQRRLYLQIRMTQIQVELGKLVDECPHNWKPWFHDAAIDTKTCDACDHSESTTCMNPISCFQGRKDL